MLKHTSTMIKNFNEFKKINENYYGSNFSSAVNGRFWTMPTPTIDKSTSVSGLTLQNAQYLNNFREWLSSTGLNLIPKVDNIYISGFKILNKIHNSSINDLEIHISFQIEDGEYFGVFKGLINNEIKFESEIINHPLLRFNRNFEKRIISSLLSELISEVTPKLGHYCIKKELKSIDSLGNIKILSPNNMIKVYEIDSSSQKIIKFKFNDDCYKTTSDGYWIFKDLVEFNENIYPESDIEIRNNDRTVSNI